MLLEEKNSQRLIATPATRGLKISVFYPKNRQNISLLVVDILQSIHTVTQAPQYLFVQRRVIIYNNNKALDGQIFHGRVPALQRPP